MDDETLALYIIELRTKGHSTKEIARLLNLPRERVVELLRTQLVVPGAIVACAVETGWADGLALGDLQEGLERSGAEYGYKRGRGQFRVAIVRQGRDDIYLSTMLWVDVFRKGILDLYPASGLRRTDLSHFLSVSFRDLRSVDVPEKVMQWIVHGAVRHARALGFEPPREFKEALPIVGKEPEGNPIGFGDRLGAS